MYQRPYTKEEILEKYSKEISDKLLGDRVHIWRAETGIELIHKEPTRREQKRIWNNWQEMTEEQKTKSDEKSLEIFGATNIENNFYINKIYYLKIFLYIFIFVSSLIIVFFVSSIKTDRQITHCGSYKQKSLQIGEKIIKVDISDDDCKRILGLSDRKKMKNDTGMLFEFPEVGNYGFWMKDMNFPIDILWIDSDFNVVGIEKSVAASTYPEIIGENYLAKYVLEVFSGFSEKNNIEVGNKIIFLEK